MVFQIQLCVLWMTFTLINGVDARLLLIVLELLAAIFLIVGVFSFFMTWQQQKQQLRPRRRVLRGKYSQWLGRVMPIITALALILPVISLFLAWFGTSAVSAIPTATSGRSVPGKTATTQAPLTAPTHLVIPGKLTVGSATSFPPQSYRDARTQQPVGFDIDLANALAQRMGLQTNIVQMRADDLVNNLTSNNLDIVISAYPITDAVKTTVQAIPYLQPSEIVLVRKGNAAGFSFTRLSNFCGHSVAVQMGTPEDVTLHTLLNQCGKTNISVKEEQDSQTAIDDLRHEIVDAVYQNSSIGKYYIQRYSGELQQLGVALPGVQEGILIRSKDDEMFSSMQKAFRQMQQDGTYAELLTRWGLTDDLVS